VQSRETENGVKEAEAQRMASELRRAGALVIATLGTPDDPENGWTVMAIGDDWPATSDEG
jgi:hypothetical protein